MPRGVRNSINYPAQIQEIDDKVQKLSERIAALKEQRQELLNRQRDAEMQELYGYMQETGMSAGDIIKQLSPSNTSAAHTFERQAVGM